MLGFTGVLIRDGTAGGGIDLGAREKVKGFSETSLLLFFDGERKRAGSMFSLSYSSKLEGSRGRLVGEKVVFEILMLDLPPNGDFCAKMPVLVRNESLASLMRQSHTNLTILRIGEMLQAWVVERCEWHSRHWSVSCHPAAAVPFDASV
jgi:hypothetical protein